MTKVTPHIQTKGPLTLVVAKPDVTLVFVSAEVGGKGAAVIGRVVSTGLDATVVLCTIVWWAERRSSEGNTLLQLRIQHLNKREIVFLKMRENK